ncbi:MAG TPA: DUF5668 domain-containing protein [Candidatus Acidoferrales bacterium]|nr:DUF5668 domain-containing protein [Candidatus Acidoferrales bacterium]
MSWRSCNCARCRIRGLMGPAVLIAIGVIFFVGQYNWDYSIERLWPVILIVVGVVQVLAATASSEGHVGGPGGYWQSPPQAPPQTPPQVPPQR